MTCVIHILFNRYNLYMSYSCFIPVITQYCENWRNQPGGPSILEIGVDRGQTAVPLIYELVRANLDFRYDMIDIAPHESLLTTLQNINRPRYKSQEINFINLNSVDALKPMKEGSLCRNNGQRFGDYSVVLIDGDHNYRTVIWELEWIMGLVSSSTMIIVDDYATRHADVDYYYDDKPEYAHFKTTPKDFLLSNGGKQGVRTAVDDFVERHGGDWVKFHCPMGKNINNGWADAVILFHKKNSEMIEKLKHPEFGNIVSGVVRERQNRTRLGFFNETGD